MLQNPRTESSKSNDFVNKLGVECLKKLKKEARLRDPLESIDDKSPVISDLKLNEEIEDKIKAIESGDTKTKTYTPDEYLSHVEKILGD